MPRVRQVDDVRGADRFGRTRLAIEPARGRRAFRKTEVDVWRRRNDLRVLLLQLPTRRRRVRAGLTDMPATRRRKFSTRFRLIVAAEVVAAFIVAFCVLRYLRTTGRDPAFASDGEILLTSELS